MKWFVTDGPTRRHAYGSTDNVLDEVEPNLGFSLSFGPGSIRPRGWRVRGEHGLSFKTLKAAKAHVERRHGV
jgi:hypothetical protein